MDVLTLNAKRRGRMKKTWRNLLTLSLSKEILMAMDKEMLNFNMKQAKIDLKKSNKHLKADHSKGGS
jgi:hypothetical protein